MSSLIREPTPHEPKRWRSSPFLWIAGALLVAGVALLVAGVATGSGFLRRVGGGLSLATIFIATQPSRINGPMDQGTMILPKWMGRRRRRH